MLCRGGRSVDAPQLTETAIKQTFLFLITRQGYNYCSVDRGTSPPAPSLNGELLFAALQTALSIISLWVGDANASVHNISLPAVFGLQRLSTVALRREPQLITSSIS